MHGWEGPLAKIPAKSLLLSRFCEKWAEIRRLGDPDAKFPVFFLFNPLSSRFGSGRRGLGNTVNRPDILNCM
jgi:hypothetical protein